MAEQNDPVLFAAVERWWQVNREPLAARGVVTSLLGPRDEPGMDPVYILQLASERAEAQVPLFRGGPLLRSRSTSAPQQRSRATPSKRSPRTTPLRHWHILLNGYSSRTASLGDLHGQRHDRTFPWLYSCT
jgi:hypothetical protein